MSAVLLYDEPPIAVSPTLCRILGVQEAVFLQQLHFRLSLKKADPVTYERYRVDGMDWVYWTYDQLLREIPIGKSNDPHKRIIKRLRQMGILLVRQLKAAEWDRTNYYSIDYRVLFSLVGPPATADASIGGNATDRDADKPQVDQGKRRRSKGGAATGHTTEIATESDSEISYGRTTTTTALSAAAAIEFHPRCEEYRGLIEPAIAGLPEKLAQQVADEIAGAMMAAEKGLRAEIQGLHGWIHAVASSAHNGKFCFQHGKPIARERANQKRKLEQAIIREQAESASEVDRIARNQAVEEFLALAPADRLEELAQVIGRSPSLQNSRQRTATMESVLQRRLPSGPLERSVVTTTMASLIPGNPQP